MTECRFSPACLHPGAQPVGGDETRPDRPSRVELAGRAPGDTIGGRGGAAHGGLAGGGRKGGGRGPHPSPPAATAATASRGRSPYTATAHSRNGHHACADAASRASALCPRANPVVST